MPHNRPPASTLVAVALLAVSLPTSLAAEDKQGERPNILFIMSDDN